MMTNWLALSKPTSKARVSIEARRYRRGGMGWRQGLYQTRVRSAHICRRQSCPFISADTRIQREVRLAPGSINHRRPGPPESGRPGCPPSDIGRHQDGGNEASQSGKRSFAPIEKGELQIVLAHNLGIEVEPRLKVIRKLLQIVPMV